MVPWASAYALKEVHAQSCTELHRAAQLQGAAESYPGSAEYMTWVFLFKYFCILAHSCLHFPFASHPVYPSTLVAVSPHLSEPHAELRQPLWIPTAPA